MAGLVWCCLEGALADAFQFAGGLVPSRGLVLGRGGAKFRIVRLGGPEFRKARGGVDDVHEAGDVFMYRDSSIAPLLDLRRRVKAFMDVLDSMIRKGVCRGSVELTVLWDSVLRAGPAYPITLEGSSVCTGCWHW